MAYVDRVRFYICSRHQLVKKCICKCRPVDKFSSRWLTLLMLCFTFHSQIIHLIQKNDNSIVIYNRFILHCNFQSYSHFWSSSFGLMVKNSVLYFLFIRSFCFGLPTLSQTKKCWYLSPIKVYLGLSDDIQH